MSRRARNYLPGFPYHFVQRDNNRDACFIEPKNYQFYLQLWREVSRRYGVLVHDYCLMTNHIHLLATPTTQAALSSTLKVAGSRYAHYINKKYRRTDTLWEGRHRSSLVQSERYLLRRQLSLPLNTGRMSNRENPGLRSLTERTVLTAGWYGSWGQVTSTVNVPLPSSSLHQLSVLGLRAMPGPRVLERFR